MDCEEEVKDSESDAEDPLKDNEEGDEDKDFQEFK